MENTKVKDEIFRHNLKIVRAIRGLSAERLSEGAKLRSKKRVLDIEEGRVSARLDEAIVICDTLVVPFEAMCTMPVKVNFTFGRD